MMTAPTRPTFQEVTMQERIDRLSPAQKRILAWAVMEFQSKRGGPDTLIHNFLLPLAEMGLDFPQIRTLVDKLPPQYPIDHRHVYFDFRLARWMRVLEPPTLKECLEDYLQHAPSHAEAMNFIAHECSDFFRTHSNHDWTMVAK